MLLLNKIELKRLQFDVTILEPSSSTHVTHVLTRTINHRPAPHTHAPDNYVLAPYTKEAPLHHTTDRRLPGDSVSAAHVLATSPVGSRALPAAARAVELRGRGRGEFVRVARGLEVRHTARADGGGAGRQPRARIDVHAAGRAAQRRSFAAAGAGAGWRRTQRLVEPVARGEQGLGEAGIAEQCRPSGERLLAHEAHAATGGRLQQDARLGRGDLLLRMRQLAERLRRLPLLGLDLLQLGRRPEARLPELMDTHVLLLQLLLGSLFVLQLGRRTDGALVRVRVVANEVARLRVAGALVEDGTRRARRDHCRGVEQLDGGAALVARDLNVRVRRMHF